jgi:hypothetical protein
MKTSIIRKQIITTSFLLLVFCCSSIELNKVFKDKQLQEIRVMEGGVLKYTLSFTYSPKGTVKKIAQFIPTREKPILIREFRHTRHGKLRIQYYERWIPGKDDSVQDVWVESFFYNRMQKLIRTETALKSSYSISRNKTPYITTRYYYRDHRPGRIVVNGGTFRKEIMLDYENKTPTHIEYKLFILNRRTRRFELQKHLRFSFENTSPCRLEDMKAQSEITDEEKIKLVLREEEVYTPLKNLRYASDFKNLLQDLEKDIRENKKI